MCPFYLVCCQPTAYATLFPRSGMVKLSDVDLDDRPDSCWRAAYTRHRQPSQRCSLPVKLMTSGAANRRRARCPPATTCEGLEVPTGPGGLPGHHMERAQQDTLPCSEPDTTISRDVAFRRVRRETRLPLYHGHSTLPATGLLWTVLDTEARHPGVACLMSIDIWAVRAFC